MRKLIIILCIVGLVTSCSSEDRYLNSLKIKREILVAVDSVDISTYTIFEPREIVKYDNWYILSSSKGDYHLLFLNPMTGDFFYTLRRGRGPGEIIQGLNLQKSDTGHALYYDYNAGIVIAIDIPSTINSRCPVMDTLANFGSAIPRPVYMTGRADKYLSGNSLDPEIWYCLYNKDGQVLSSVEELGYEEMQDGSPDYRISTMLSSKYTISLAGNRACVANVASASLSFASIEHDVLREYKRYELYPPSHQSGRNGLSPENISAFCALDSDESFVYALYSGHAIKGDVAPAHECNHLIIYDWYGDVVHHYVLDKFISAFYIENGIIYGASTFNGDMLYKFIL